MSEASEEPAVAHERKEHEDAEEPSVLTLEENGCPDPVVAKRRKVRLTKVSGKETGKPRIPLVGFEDAPPEKGREYRVLTEQGTTFQTSPVLKVAPGYIQTQNAFYELAIIKEDALYYGPASFLPCHVAEESPLALAEGN